MQETQLRVMYIAGPGDVVQTFTAWCNGEDDPNQIAITYSSQFFDRCEKLGIAGLAISRHSHCKSVQRNDLKAENRPSPAQGKSGIAFHLGQIWYCLYLFRRALAFHADLILVSPGLPWFMMYLFKSTGMKVVPTLHSVLWPKYGKVRNLDRVLIYLSRRLFRKSSFAILSISDDVTGQIKQLTGTSHSPIISFLPTYRPDLFRENVIKKQNFPPRILFSGRIEEDKGVFLLLEIAQRFDSLDISVHFDICGDGSELERLKQAVNEKKLQGIFTCHGYCNRSIMEQMYLAADLVVVPTMTNFREGFNKVLVEGVLAGKPVVTSSVCCAEAYVQEAVVLAEPDNIDSYAEAIQDVLFNTSKADRMPAAGDRYREMFMDPGNSWGEAFSMVAIAAQQGKQPRQRIIRPVSEINS